MDYFIGEVRLVSFTTVPKNWAICNGALLPINQNQALFSLLGTAYGGDGIRTFGLPDLRSRIPVGFGNNNPLGPGGGSEQVTLTPATLPVHAHGSTSGTVKTSTEALDASPNGMFVAPSAVNQFAAPPATGTLAQNTVQLTLQPAGNGQPHENRQPYLAINYLISLAGIFPSRA